MIVLRTLAYLCGMVAAAAGLAWALVAAGAVLQPPSSAVQSALLGAGLFALALSHAIRSRPAVRVVAVEATPALARHGRTPVLMLTGGVIVVAFACPSRRPASPSVVLAERHDKLFVPARPEPNASSGTKAPAPFDAEIWVASKQPLALREPAAAPDTLDGAEIAGPRIGLRLRTGSRSGLARIGVGEDSYAWPLPGKRMAVSASAADATTSTGFDLARRLDGSTSLVPADPAADVWPLGRLIEPLPPPYDDPGRPWQEYAIFLTGTPLDVLTDSFAGVRALPSLSSTGGKTNFRGPDSRAGESFAVALTRNYTTTEAPMVEYVWVQYGPRGLPVLSAGGGGDEPFDALGESAHRRVPRSLLEHYALAWRRIDASSPRLAALPSGGHFFDGVRRSARLPLALDVPRGLGRWEPLGLVAVVLLLWRLR